MDPAPDSLSDQDLARQTRSGSLEAFEELVLRYENRVFAFVSRLCGDAMAAREITQDTFLKAFQAIARYDDRRSFAAWLFTIARRKSIDHHRAAWPSADESLPELADLKDPAELMARREEVEALWDLARRGLSTAQFQALWLRYAADLSIAEIAQVLRKTRTHVKVLLFRARQGLSRQGDIRTLLGTYWASQPAGPRPNPCPQLDGVGQRPGVCGRDSESGPLWLCSSANFRTDLKP